MYRQFWTRWWIGFGVLAVTVFVVNRIIEAVDDPSAWLQVLGSVLFFAAAALWLALSEVSFRADRAFLSGRYSTLWGRTLPPSLFVILLLSLIASLLGRILGPSGALSQVALTIVGILFLIWLAWFALGGLVVIAFWIARTARDKGRSYVAWFWLGLFFPLIAWIIVASMSPVPGARSTDDSSDMEATSELRTCPYCAEAIRVQAIKCKHCGEFIRDDSGAQDVQS